MRPSWLDDPGGQVVYTDNVPAEWIDNNGHMNVAWYGHVFDRGVDALWLTSGHGQDYRRRHPSTTFAVESHSRYISEITVGEPFAVSTRLIAIDDKRLHQFQCMWAPTSAGKQRLIATCEWLHLHVDSQQRRVTPWPTTIRANLTKLLEQQRDLPWPDAVSAAITMRRRNT
ncbi:MAG: thioesterase family protein [Pseudomonadota bacterium]